MRTLSASRGGVWGNFLAAVHSILQRHSDMRREFRSSDTYNQVLCRKYVNTCRRHLYQTIVHHSTTARILVYPLFITVQQHASSCTTSFKACVHERNFPPRPGGLPARWWRWCGLFFGVGGFGSNFLGGPRLGGCFRLSLLDNARVRRVRARLLALAAAIRFTFASMSPGGPSVFLRPVINPKHNEECKPYLLSPPSSPAYSSSAFIIVSHTPVYSSSAF